MNVHDCFFFCHLNFQLFQAILGGTVICDVRDGKFYQLPVEEVRTFP